MDTAWLISTPKFKNKACITPWVKTPLKLQSIKPTKPSGYEIVAAIPLIGDSEWDIAIQHLFMGWQPPSEDPYDLELAEYLKGKLVIAIYWFRYYKLGKSYIPKIERNSINRSRSKDFITLHKALGRLLFALSKITDAEFNLFGEIYFLDNDNLFRYDSSVTLWFYAVREIIPILTTSKKNKTELIKYLRKIIGNRSDSEGLRLDNNTFDYDKTPHLWRLFELAIGTNFKLYSNSYELVAKDSDFDGKRTDILRGNVSDFIKAFTEWIQVLDSTTKYIKNNKISNSFRILTEKREAYHRVSRNIPKSTHNSQTSSKDQKIQANSLLLETIEKLLENEPEWRGTASHLLTDLNCLNSEVGRLINKPEGLGVRLSKVKFALKEKSIDLVRERTPSKERLIRLSKRP